MISLQTAGNRVVRQQQSCDAFTLTELLVVLGTVVILSVILVPALAATKPNSKAAQCLNSKRQLALAWQMYATDNSDLLLGYTTWISSSFMDWSTSSANTNTDYLTNPTNALIARYVKSAAIFKCPADYYQSPAQSAANLVRVRSVSLNGALGGGSGPTVEGLAPGGGHYFGAGPGLSAGSCTKMSDLAKPGPAAVFAFLDEQADSINDGAFMLNPGWAPGHEFWRDLPASYHNNAGSFSFADGHAEIVPWHVLVSKKRTNWPVTYFNYPDSTTSPWGSVNLGINADYEWMDAHMPYR